VTVDDTAPPGVLETLHRARRIMVVGSPGAGKTTLARQLAETTGLPLVHLDDLHWLRDWQRPELAVWRRIQAEAADADRWIIDGHYERDLGIRARRADVAVLVHCGRLRCLYRVLRRGVRIRCGTWELLPRRVQEQARAGLPVTAHADLVRLVRTVLTYRLDRCLSALSPAVGDDGAPRVVVVVRPGPWRARRRGRLGGPSAPVAAVVTPAALKQPFPSSGGRPATAKESSQ
jgi:hypothetical protein